MYENQTFDTILQRMLERIPDTVDKREGSVIFDALAPAAVELTQMYFELSTILSLSFGETTSGIYLDLRAADRGLTRKAASPAQRLGVFYGVNDTPLDVPIGSRYGISGVNYAAVSRISPGNFALVAETSGTVGNLHFGALLPIDYIPGLSRAEIADIRIPGTDTETDEALRERYLTKVREPSTSGNAAHYRQWALEVPGVGAAKVIPLWDGPGTVKVTIVDIERHPATPALLAEVVDYIAEVSPIGADVTVVSAEGFPININATVTLATGYTLPNVQAAFKQAVDDYMKATAFELTYVSYARIGTLLLGTTGVIDYSSLTVNGGTVNVAIQDDYVPMTGTLVLGV
ncbi:baseplate J/gp47 family protein [Paenibacillus eucommiae]|uniref:Phage protein gp47/JayE n=1 Tax=Paenibacillus eucommiae TaxID=1355755 RepID=A0ABS4IRM7_9BACL|nr:baseplate J/gp47 family protein [Paenibacillus eucommiae]MBP1990203.1 putative phage protein gp47/JayE [Paenibacillus eucommiae]